MLLVVDCGYSHLVVLDAAGCGNPLGSPPAAAVDVTYDGDKMMYSIGLEAKNLINFFVEEFW